MIHRAGGFFSDLWKKTPTSFVLLFFFTSLYLFTLSGTISYGDEVEKYRVAQSIVDRHTLAIRPTPIYHTVGVDRQTYSTYELGQSILEIPFYVWGKVVNAVFPNPDVNWTGQLFIGLLNPILTALTCVLLFKTCQSLEFSYRTGLILTLVFGLATIAWRYSKGFTREPLLGFLILLTFYVTHLFKKTSQLRWLLVAGLVAGYLVFAKFLQFSVLPFFALFVGICIFQAQTREGGGPKKALAPIVTGLVVFALPIITFLILQGLYAIARFGTISVGVGGTRSDFTSVVTDLLSQSNPAWMSLRILFSPEKSVFLYSPPILLFVVAWFKWFRSQAAESLLLLALILSAVGISLMRPDGDGGSWWGPRYLVQITPLAVIPIGVLIEPSDQAAGRFWTRALAVLFAMGLLVQLVGTLTSDRDYLDITSSGTNFFGEFYFLTHGALDSLVLYLSPAGFPIRINPFGVVLIVFVALSGAWIVTRLQRPTRWIDSSQSYGIALLIVFVGILFLSFVVWIVAPYSRVLSSKADSEFVAGNLFLADGKKCEARDLYVLALERGTNHQEGTLARLRGLGMRESGEGITAQDLIQNLELQGEANVTVDMTRTLFGGGSLKVAASPPGDAIARAVSDPIPVLPSESYELAGWISTENVYGTGYGVVTVHEDDGNYGHARGTDIELADETSGWHSFQKTIQTLPTTRRVFIAGGLWKTFGTVWLDGLALTKTFGVNSPSGLATPCH